MSKLYHSQDGARRAMQISEAQLFAFVEGGMDRPFVSRILNSLLKEKIRFKVHAIKEVANGTGGKPSLLAKYTEFSENGVLNAEQWKKRTVCIFFFDKDVDDYLNIAIQSPYVTYTKCYDVEGELFTHGNLNAALADALLITPEQAAAYIPEKNKWLRTAAEDWLDWITLCMLSQKWRISVGCTFDRESAINTLESGEVEEKKLHEFKRKLIAAREITEVEFDQEYAATRREVILSIRKREPLKFFKGKWLKGCIQRAVDAREKVYDACTNSVGDRVLLALLGHIGNDLKCSCVQQYKDFIHNATRALNLAS